MAKAYITKTIRFEPPFYAEIEEAMSASGLTDFSEFVRRAITSELEYEALRRSQIRYRAEQSLIAAEDGNEYNAPMPVDPEAAAELDRLVKEETERILAEREAEKGA